MALSRTTVTTTGILLVTLASLDARAQTCTTQSRSYDESFDDTVFRDASTSASGWGLGTVKLALKGNSFDSTAQNVGEKVYVAGSGDFDGDGWVDLVAVILSPDRIHFLKNLGLKADGSHAGFSTGGIKNSVGWKAQIVDAAPPGMNSDGPAIYAGDFDGDGDPDVLYMKTANQNTTGSADYSYVYRNDGLVAGLPKFTRLDFTAFFAANRISWHKTVTWGQIIDWNKDGYDDLVAASSWGTTNEVLLFKAKTDGSIGWAAPIKLVADIGLVKPFADTGKAVSATACVSNPSTKYSLGSTAIAVADYDNDDDYDMVIGSVNQKEIKFWRNDGSDVFTQQPDIWFGYGGPTFIVAGDFDGDGDQDFVPGRDGYLCGGAGGTAWFFANNGKGSFTMRAAPLLDAGFDLDFGAALYIDENLKYPALNKGKTEYTLDIIAADGNDSGTYNTVLGQRSNVYNLSGTATSKVVDALDNTSNAIVAVTMTALDAFKPLGTNVVYSVSNDNGITWEQLTPEEVYSVGTPKTHTFSHFGSDFRYRMELSSEASVLVGEEAVLAPGTKKTPEVRSIAFSYEFVTRREYSRSALAYANDLQISTSVKKNVVFSSTFFYPGYEGTLRAYDQGVALRTTSESSNDLNQAVVKTGLGSAVIWDAGELLKSRGSATRTIYTALPDSSGNVTTRTGFTAANAPTLASYMVTDADTASKVISFVRSGFNNGSGTKLYDVGHSSPVFIGPPNTTYVGADVALNQDNYAAFVTQQASRQPIVYIGSNSGMVHAFDAVTGNEVWAFVPFNLLAKLKGEMATNSDGVPFYEHKYMVDGSVIVRDVYNRLTGAWRTILIAGEALGQGRSDNNYYFALDVTDPANPQPIWEFTDGWLGQGSSCTGSTSRTVCVDTPVTSCTSSCDAANHAFVVSEPGYIAMEAESYNSTTQLDLLHSWQRATTGPSGYYGTGYIQSVVDIGTDCNNNYTTCGALAAYSIRVATAGTYSVMIRYSAPDSGSNGVRVRFSSLDEKVASLPTTGTGWSWYRTSASVALAVGEYDLNLFMTKDGLKVDKIIVATTGSAFPSTLTPLQTCAQQCTITGTTTSCTTENYDPARESYECGVGSGLKCCNDPARSATTYWCAPVGKNCDDLDTVNGETWSPPVVAPVNLDGGRNWLVFVGSGYNNRTNIPVAAGRSVYAIDALTGALRGQWDYNDLPYNAVTNPSTIDNTIPGGLAVYDFTTSGSDSTPDGYADAAYFGDLEGRLWKIDLHAPASSGSSGRVPATSWPTCTVFDAGQPAASGFRVWAPIVTTPAVTSFISDAAPHRPYIYFGTGGDDRVPSSSMYRFYSVRDSVTCPGTATPTTSTSLNITSIYADNTHYQWVVGDGLDNQTGNPVSPYNFEGVPGQRYWSDPTIFDNSIVYFASLGGSIESVNPCSNLADSSLLYGYALRDFSGGDGARYKAGTSIVPASLNSGAWYRSASKIRRSALIAHQAPTAGVAQSPTASPSGNSSATQVFIQTFDGEVRSVTTPTLNNTNSIRVMRWREIPLK